MPLNSPKLKLKGLFHEICFYRNFHIFLCFTKTSFAKLNWNLVEGGIFTAEIEGSTGTPSGYGVNLSRSLTDNIFVFGNYVTFDDAELDISSTSVGLGYRFSINNNNDVLAKLSYENVEIAEQNSFFSSSFAFERELEGFSFGTGVRSRFFDSIETEIGLYYVSIDEESGTAGNVNIHYYFTDRIALGVNFSKDPDGRILSLVTRYAFD